MLDWLRLWPEFVRLNFQKARHRRRLSRALQAVGTRPLASAGPAPCQSVSDSGREGMTRCEACHRLDRSARYRFVCPDLRVVGGQTLCAVDASAVRPYWGRAVLALLGPPLLVMLALGFGGWALLRQQGLSTLSPLDLLLPARWDNIGAARRVHFQRLTFAALSAGDPATASIALFNAAQAGTANPEETRALARLATLGHYHSLADDLHADALRRYPGRAGEIVLAWHDDLLVGDRPAQLARLALQQLGRTQAARDFWLNAFFESLLHRGVAAALLAQPGLVLPHPGLRHALGARAELDRGDALAAADQLIALEGLPPGPAVRRFLAVSWGELGEPARALAAALDRSHPASPDEPDEPLLLAYAVRLRAGELETARATLRPLLARPEAGSAVLAALVRDPDPVLCAELEKLVSRAPHSDEPRHLAAHWLAAKRAGCGELAHVHAAKLAQLGQPLPPELLAAPLDGSTRGPLVLAGTLLPLDREILYALRAPLATGPVSPATGVAGD
jgi:hypothetical protein